jgi:hypothetical protein
METREQKRLEEEKSEPEIYRQLIPLLRTLFDSDFEIKTKFYDEPQIVITNKKEAREDNMCAKISVSDNTIVLDELSSCSIQNGGTINLTKILAFSKLAKTLGFTQIKLLDASTIYYISNGQLLSVDLSKLRLLQTGQTWYQKFGFSNKSMELYGSSIIRFINTPIQKIIIDNQKNLQNEMNLLLTFTKFMVHLVSKEYQITQTEAQKEVGKYSFYNGIDESLTVKDFFSFIINRMKTLCPFDERHKSAVGTCPDQFKTLINSLSDLVDTFYKIMMIRVIPKDIDGEFYLSLGKRSKRVKKCNKSKRSKRVKKCNKSK